ncbi:unnamed protein product [Phytophthora fragariaefolia]|uniref:Unnamed protein product n=1 Tax=Phytophthora fragariaefolia TaxID=1490495 RepID=A0A9W6TLF6_9STRA|nr:unnamed protein product [Phytophthora fragariaefolia]
MASRDSGSVPHGHTLQAQLPEAAWPRDITPGAHSESSRYGGMHGAKKVRLERDRDKAAEAKLEDEAADEEELDDEQDKDDSSLSPPPEATLSPQHPPLPPA